MDDESLEIQKEAYRLSEALLQSQLTAALASDQRGIQVASISVATGALMATLSSQAEVPLAFLMGSILLLFASFLAAYAAKPSDFYMPGARYSDFDLDISEKRGVSRVLRDMGRFNDQHIEYNDAKMRRAGWFLRWSYWFSIIAVAVALAPQLSPVRVLFWRSVDWLEIGKISPLVAP